MSLIPRLSGLAVATYFLIAVSTSFAADDDGMRTHRTQSGLFFRYPATWQAQESQGAVVLVPDDATRDEQGQPMQMLLVGSFPAPAGATDPRDAGVVSQAEAEIAGLFPGLTRVGDVESFETKAGPGAIYTFQGSVGGGPLMRLKAILKLRKGQGLCVMYFARQDVATRYEDMARRIGVGLKLSDSTTPASASASGAPRAGALPGGATGAGGDPALVRSWSWIATSGSSSSTGGLYANDSTTWTFRADGTVERETSTTISGGGADWSTVSEPSSSVARGTYAASGGTLTIQWADGSSDTFTYSTFEHEGSLALKLQRPGGKPMYFQ